MPSTLEADEIKRVKVRPEICPKCKADLMLKPTEKVCPVSGDLLSKKGRE